MNWKDILSQWISEAETQKDFERANKMRATWNVMFQLERVLN